MSRQKNEIGAENPICLRAYRPELEQSAHRHRRPHLSLVLGGSLVEASGDAESHVGPGMFAVRAGEFSHQVRFGAGGALIVSLGISGSQFAGLDGADVGRWIRASNDLVNGVMASALRDNSAAHFEDAIWDVLAGQPSGPARAPPQWLLDARDRLTEEDATVMSAAEHAGIHRVHFSRAFSRAFGLPPTLYRRRLRGFRAVVAALEGQPAALSAYECGFADQSHMSRVIRHMTGTSYKRLQMLRTEVTSVQE